MNHILEIMPHIKYNENEKYNVSFSAKLKAKNKDRAIRVSKWGSYNSQGKPLIVENLILSTDNLLYAFKNAPKEVVDNNEAKIILSAVKTLPYSFPEDVSFSNWNIDKASSKINKDDLISFNNQAINIIREFSNVLPHDNRREFDNLMLKRNFDKKEEKEPKRKRRKTML